MYFRKSLRGRYTKSGVFLYLGLYIPIHNVAKCSPWKWPWLILHSVLFQQCSSLAPRIESLQTLTLSLPNGAICKNYLCSSSKNMRSSKSACSTCQEVVKIVSTSFVDAGKLVDDILADVDSICSSLKTEAAQQKVRHMCNKSLP